MLVTLNAYRVMHNGSAFEQNIYSIPSNSLLAKFTVGLRAGSEDMAGIFDDFLQTRASVLEAFLCRQSAVTQPYRHFGLRMPLVSCS